MSSASENTRLPSGIPTRDQATPPSTNASPPLAPLSAPPYVGTLAPFRDGLPLTSAAYISAPGAVAVPAGAPAQNPRISPAPVTPPQETTGGARPVLASALAPGMGAAFIRVFSLSVKLLPVFLVLGGAGYVYKSFFGKMSEQEMADAGIRVQAGMGPQSRTSLMINQTKSVVAAQSANVSLANQLADTLANGGDLDKIGLPETTKLAPPPPPAAPRPTPVNMPSLPTEDQAANDPTTIVFVPVSAGMGPPPPPATPAFAQWAKTTRLSGVRLSTSTPRALVNGVLFKGGDTVEHRLGIVFHRVDPHTKAVVFREPSGALLALRF